MSFLPKCCLIQNGEEMGNVKQLVSILFGYSYHLFYHSLILNFKEQILQIAPIIADKSGLGNPEGWTDGDFVDLSEKILESTGVSISRNTLKRIFGKEKTPTDYAPNKSTKKAIAQYIGYDSWNAITEIKSESTLKAVVEKPSSNSLSGKKYSYTISSIVIIIGVIFFTYYNTETLESNNTGTDYISLLNLKTDTIKNGIIPYTIKVEYTYPPDFSDSLYLFINKSQLLMKPNEKLIKHTFINSGLFTIRVGKKTDKQKVHTFLAEDQKWRYEIYNKNKTTVVYKSEKLSPFIFEPEHAILGKYDTLKDQIWTGVNKNAKFDIKSNNFKFFIKFKSQKRQNYEQCADINFRIKNLFSHESIGLMLNEYGCHSYLFLKYGKVDKIGFHDSLDFLSHDVTQLSQLVITSHRDTFRVEVNDSLRLEDFNSKIKAFDINQLRCTFGNYGTIDSIGFSSLSTE